MTSGPRARARVFRVAEEGDAVAADVIGWPAVKRASLACGVIRQVETRDPPLRSSLSGACTRAASACWDRCATTILAVAPRAALVRLAAYPVVGAVFWAWSRVGGEWMWRIDTSGG